MAQKHTVQLASNERELEWKQKNNRIKGTASATLLVLVTRLV